MAAAAGPRRTEQDNIARLIGSIRYARIWTERMTEADPRDAFFDALEAPPVIDEPVAAPAKAVRGRVRPVAVLPSLAPREPRRPRSAARLAPMLAAAVR
jgi:hypothetical protein